MAPLSSSGLLPPTFHEEPIDLLDLKIASIAFGFTIGFGYLTGVKAASQSISIYRRTHRVKFYIWMLWLELLVSTLFAVVTWLYLDGILPPSFGVYFGLVTLWVLQIQLLLQIIINRIALLMMTPKLANRLKWGVAGFILLINISVYCIWVPARLQISDKYIHINNIWDRIEKTIYLIVDGGLNAYFIWLVQAKLVSQGLQKYRPLFKFNIFIVCFSLAMDVMLIGTMSLKNSFVYMQFHPVAYIVKLNIEMTMADLIIKIVRSSTRDASYSHSRSGYNPPDVPGSAPRAHLHRRRGSAKRFSVSTGAQGIKGYAGIRSLSENPARPPTSTPPDLPIQGPLKELSEPDKPYGSEFSSTVDIEAVPVRPRDELELDSLHPRASIMKTVATVISSSSAMGRGSVTPDWSQKDEN